MALADFSDRLTVRVIEGETDIGTIQFAGDDEELAHIRLFLLIKGTYGGSETIRINFYSVNDVLLFSSDYSTLSEISNIGDNWLGWLRFDFDRQLMSPNDVYTMKVETQNYSRNGDTFYLAVVYDWPEPISTQNAPNYSVFAAPYTYRRLQDEF